MEKTAVEWLFDNLNLCFDKFDNGEYSYTEFVNASKEMKKQAKEMEKEQIINAYINGIHSECYKNGIGIGCGKHYYNQTYKQD